MWVTHVLRDIRESPTYYVTNTYYVICHIIRSCPSALCDVQVYYVIPVELILCKADITRDPVTPRIPAGALPTSSGDKWNFPKLHAMFHVADEIRR